MERFGLVVQRLVKKAILRDTKVRQLPQEEVVRVERQRWELDLLGALKEAPIAHVLFHGTLQESVG